MGPGQAPARAQPRPKSVPPIQYPIASPTKFLGWDHDFVAADGPDLAGLDERHRDHRYRHGSGDNPVHVERLESKHLLDAKPRHHLALGGHDAEVRADSEIDAEARAAQGPGPCQAGRGLRRQWSRLEACHLEPLEQKREDDPSGQQATGEEPQYRQE